MANKYKKTKKKIHRSHKSQYGVGTLTYAKIPIGVCMQVQPKRDTKFDQLGYACR